MKAIFSTGNRHDSTLFEKLIKGLKKAWFILADAAYDSKKNRNIARKYCNHALIDRNPRRNKIKTRKPWLLKTMRFVIEETNSNLKDSVLQNKWTKIRRFERKASFVYCGVIALQVMAIDNILKNRGGEWMRVSEYR
ncbi:MAG: transposase [Candidatus Aenigmatarchaeota archaeon]